jgi:hypothetical protein
MPTTQKPQIQWYFLDKEETTLSATDQRHPGEPAAKQAKRRLRRQFFLVVLLRLGLWQVFLHYRVATEPHPLLIRPPDQQRTTDTTTATLSGDGQFDPIEQHCSQQPPEVIAKSCDRRQARLTLPTSVPEEPKEQHCSQLPPILGPTNCSTFSRRQTP